MICIFLCSVVIIIKLKQRKIRNKLSSLKSLGPEIHFNLQHIHHLTKDLAEIPVSLNEAVLKGSLIQEGMVKACGHAVVHPWQYRGE